ncbi:small G protein signaling modulator 2 isoform X2 [Bufo gargarizans]|uniref:small G protein signaling modulator 2 isoform X2 n=1 Tax=Bufo gargarizans TaxID=30331 RepID=UPI001CF0E266|nr:small G protein signaling modulator 2 isoform X2 [Bufo gargarizans]
MSCSDDSTKEKLLWNVKKEVKQIMEEAVTRKFVHEDSSHIIALCGVVEACLLHLLKRRAAGFLRSDKVAALFMKVAKTCATAADICKKVQDLQQQVEGRKNFSNGQDSLKRQCSTTSRTVTLTPQALKHIWVRTALIEKVLDKIVQYIVDNSSKYYEKEALMSDPVCGPILAVLLVGPCAFEYTKLKTADHYWTDPSADELVQRHRIHGAYTRQDSSPFKRPALGIKKRHSSGSMTEDKFAASAREYVESLHQNSRIHLLYGKNNVLVQPKEDMEAIPGYLSLHQSGENLTLKWTPNQLLNGTLGDSELEKSVFWDYALIVPISQIVCIHCHHRPESKGVLVLVSQDGIQRPPLHFPPGGHLLAFLSCLENGLLPRGQLEPPLWSQRGKGKVFPKLRKRNSSNKSVDFDDNVVEEVTADYVFRIIYAGHRHDNITINYHHLAASRSVSVDDDEEEEDRLHAMLSMISSRNLTAPKMMKDSRDVIEMQGFGANLLPWQLNEYCSQGSPCLSCSTGSSPYDLSSCCTCVHDRAPLKLLCENMKRQIVSRAFYGWLAYCRHLSTVRTHLSALVHHSIIPPDKPTDASGGLTKEVWSKYQKDMKNYKELELLRLVYYGGVEHDIRKEVWPFLLGHYKFGMTKKEMDRVDEAIASRYQKVMAEWKACEVIVKLREKESHSAIYAKLSSGSSIDSHVQRLIHRDSTISNDVFMSTEDIDMTDRDLKCRNDKNSTVTIVAGTPSAMVAAEPQQSVEFDSPDSGLPSSRNYSVTSGILSSIDDQQSICFEEEESSTESDRTEMSLGPRKTKGVLKMQDSICEEQLCTQLEYLNNSEDISSMCPTSYTIELLDTIALNLHRIDKDVQRCDRNYWYFTPDNLEKLRNIMCSYVWEHLDVGYVQGMCDLLAPLMVVLDNDLMAYSCFTQLMKRMSQNFPNGGAMDTHFANMRSLIQILDSELFELMHQNGDYTHFYFCYRWFLLDFKRELLYEDVFAVWEVIWAARLISSEHFVLFIALALVQVYREIVRDNNMDFTDIIKFFNEMAEHHDAQLILRIARELVHKVQTLIENK